MQSAVETTEAQGEYVPRIKGKGELHFKRVVRIPKLQSKTVLSRTPQFIKSGTHLNKTDSLLRNRGEQGAVFVAHIPGSYFFRNSFFERIGDARDNARVIRRRPGDDLEQRSNNGSEINGLVVLYAGLEQESERSSTKDSELEPT
jgi:hypothetical protein